MAIPTRCPCCGTPYQVTERQAGQTVRCRQCQQVFAVPAAGPPDLPLAREIKPGRAEITPPAARPRPVPPPLVPGAGARQPPRKGPGPGKSSRPYSPATVIGLAVTGVAVVVFGAVSAWLLFRPKPAANPPEKEHLAQNDAPRSWEAPERAADAAPPRPAPADLALPQADLTLEERKAATVFVKVAAGPVRATGSGFLIRTKGNTGYLVTNAHVISPEPAGRPRRLPGGRPMLPAPAQVSVVFHSGTRQEQAIAAEVLAADPEQDLAVLQVRNVLNLPRPINLRRTPKLVETLPVTLYGFPFGEALAFQKGNPSITVGRGSISSLRRNEQDEIVAVQIDGALNPGNSGGPVLDADGRLVGVAVATIRGAGIGLAIPATEVTKMLDGRVGAATTSVRVLNTATAEVSVTVPLIDPLRRVDQVAVRYLRTDLVKAAVKPDREGKWPELPGAQQVQLRRVQQLNQWWAVGTFQVPLADQHQTFTLQTFYVNGSGRRVGTPPRALALVVKTGGPSPAPLPPNQPPVVVRPGPPAVPVRPVLPPTPPNRPPVVTSPAQLAPPVTVRPQLPKLPREEVPLPGVVSEVAVGGGGRYLILCLAGQRKLAVFDVNQAKVAKYLPLAEEIVHFAAGATRLAVVYPNAKLIQLWSLETFAKERTAPLPASLTGDDIHQVCMGSASAGPLFVYLPREKRTLALDLTGLTTTEVRWNHWAPNNAYGPLHMRASPDGTLLLGWAGGWAGLDMAVFDGGKQIGAYDRFEFSLGIFALPSADGRLIFTPWAIVGRDLTPTKVPELVGRAYLVPAHEPGYFLALHHAGNQGLPRSPYGKKDAANLPPVTEVAIYTDDRKRLVALSELDELKDKSVLYWEQRVHYYPRAGLLVTLAKQANADRLVLRRCDLVGLLDRAGVDYLFVASQPPTAKAGSAFTYRLEVRSKKGKVQVKLESGPPGMKVTPEGLVTWSVPADFAEREADVLLTISDASGQEIFHNFKVVLTGP